MQDLAVRGRGPVVNISTGDDSIVRVSTNWSAVTFVVFALQALGISIRSEYPVMDEDGDLVLLLTGLNGAAVDPEAVWRTFDEMGFRATLTHSPEAT